MSKTAKTACGLCGRAIDYNSEQAGALIKCPSCNEVIELSFPRQAKTPPIPQPQLNWSARQPMKKGPLVLCICVLVFLGIGLIVSALVTKPSPPSGYRNFSWGDPPTELLTKKSGPTSDGLTIYAPTSGLAIEPLFGVPVSYELLTFSGGGFEGAMVWLNGKDNYVRMKAELIKRLGKPTVAYPQSSSCTWKWKNSRVHVSIGYFEKPEQTHVSFENEDI